MIFIFCSRQNILKFYFGPDAEKQHAGSPGSPAEGARRHVREGQQGDEEHSGQGIGAMNSVVVFLHIGNKDMKSTPAKVVLNLNLSLKLLWLLTTKACTPLRPICWCHGRSRCVWCCFGFCRWNTRICKQYPDIGGDRPRCTSGQKPEDEGREGENHQGEECKQH